MLLAFLGSEFKRSTILKIYLKIFINMRLVVVKHDILKQSLK